MNKVYSRINWENEPSTKTPLNEHNLNKIDFAVDEIDNRVIELDSTKAKNTELQTLSTRIDNLILNAGDSSVEAADARVTEDGTVYDTLKNRLDAEHSNVTSDISQLSDEIYHIIDENIIIPAFNTDVFEFFIPSGEKFVFETIDGTTFDYTTVIRFYNSDRNELGYYSVFANSTNRECENSWGEDVHYVRMGSELVPKDIRIRLNDSSKLLNKYRLESENRYEKLMSFNKLTNRSTSIIIHGSQLRNGSIANTKNTECVSTQNILTSFKKIRVITDRPNLDNCEYLYSFASAKTINPDLNYDRQYDNHVDYDNNTNNTYTITDNSFGVQIAITERNKDSGEITGLRISDFEDYTIAILEVKDESNNYLIPDFYENYIDERIKTIRNNDLIVGNTGDSFVFITDLHNENNYYSPKLAKRIIDKTSVNKVVYGGDLINEPTLEKSEVAGLLFDRVNLCRTVDDCIFLVGNHDTNPLGTHQITKSELYSIIDKSVEKFINTNSKTYFYRDNESQKIRYFYLDSGEGGAMDSVQSEWLKTNSEMLGEDWTIVIMSHHGIYTETKDDRTPLRYPIISEIKTALENVTCSVACIICGHTHIDFADTSENYPIICTTCDAHGVQASSMSSDVRSVGTINEQAFDVFHINTLTKTIYVTRIGGGQNDVTVSGDYALNDRIFNYS